MKPIPHLIDSCLVVDIDFTRGWVLLGELSRAGDPTATVYKHVRLRLADDGWHRDRVERGSIPCPPLHAESWHWRPDRQPLDRVHVSPVPAPVIVERRDLQRALDRVFKLSGRSLDVAGLHTVRVHERGLSLASHGEAVVVADVSKVGDSPARDGLGTVVVLGGLLRAVVKEARDKIEVTAEPRSEGRALVVNGHRVWTVNAAPLHVQASEPASCETDAALSAAVVRALMFACTDEARPNLNHVAFHGRGDSVIVESTDGHRLYRERVHATFTFGSGFYTVPQHVLASLRSGKRAGAYRFAVVGADVIVTCDGVTVVCRPSAATWPPCAEILAPVLRELEQRSAYGWETRTLAGPVANALRTWLNEQDGDETLQVQFADDPLALRILTTTGPTCFGGERFALPISNRRDATPWNIARGFTAQYLADALAAFPKDGDVSFTLSAGDLDPIYLTDATRTVCVMPRRL